MACFFSLFFPFFFICVVVMAAPAYAPGPWACKGREMGEGGYATQGAFWASPNVPPLTATHRHPPRPVLEGSDLSLLRKFVDVGLSYRLSGTNAFFSARE